MEDLIVNTHSLHDLAFERRSETLREAFEARRARQLTRNQSGLRERLANALVATGETFVNLGTSLVSRSE